MQTASDIINGTASEYAPATPAPKVKLTLTVPKNEVLALTNGKTIGDMDSPRNVLFLDYTLEDRADVESDTTKLQPIVYVILKDIVEDKYFIYKRGKGGTEPGLIGLCSIGLGGHAEEPITDEANSIAVLAFTAAREVHEEVGLPLTAHLIESIENKLSRGKFFLLHSEDRPVDAVHLGIGLVLEVNSKLLFKTEENIIVNTDWLSKAEITAFLQPDSQTELETWTKIALQHL